LVDNGCSSCDFVELLYANIDWLSAHQADIETRLFQSRNAFAMAGIFLYDVTSSYS